MVAYTYLIQRRIVIGGVINSINTWHRCTALRSMCSAALCCERLQLNGDPGCPARMRVFPPRKPQTESHLLPRWQNQFASCNAKKKKIRSLQA
jgi:hypothetical protein